jgi:hypothetical protein
VPIQDRRASVMSVEPGPVPDAEQQRFRSSPAVAFGSERIGTFVDPTSVPDVDPYNGVLEAYTNPHDY